ncbi:Uncharacterised protein [uncultured archaeon]|nr:Uncharacterised protein [uncultured archaeon]
MAKSFAQKIESRWIKNDLAEREGRGSIMRTTFPFSKPKSKVLDILHEDALKDNCRRSAAKKDRKMLLNQLSDSLVKLSSRYTCSRSKETRQEILIAIQSAAVALVDSLKTDAIKQLAVNSDERIGIVISTEMKRLATIYDGGKALPALDVLDHISKNTKSKKLARYAKSAISEAEGWRYGKHIEPAVEKVLEEARILNFL